MFNQDKIANATYNYVGIREIDETSPLATPTKGIFIEDVCPLLTYDQLKATLAQQAIDEDYATLLESKFKYYVKDVLAKITTHKKVTNTNRTVLDRMTVFNGLAQVTDTIVNNSKFCGWMIALNKGKDTVLKIRSIGIQATAAQTNLPIYVFHTSQRAPIATRSVTTTKGGSFQWVDLETPIELSYYASRDDNQDYDTGGFFYIGYFQDDLNGQTIKKQINLISPPCSTCDGGRYYRKWAQWSKFLTIRTGEVDSTKIDSTDPKMVDSGDIGVVDSNNYGLNFDITIECDLTKFVMDHLHILVEPIKYSIANGLLNELIYNSRDNVSRDKTLALANRALHGDVTSGIKGISHYYKAAIDALDFDLSKLSSVCAGATHVGVRTKSV